MTVIRRFFYLLIGLTFPGFWLLHAAGYGATLYRPIQRLVHTTASGWPSLLTATLLYLAAILIFEMFFQLVKNAQP